MLTLTQVIRAAIDAQELVQSLVEAKVYSRWIGMGDVARNKADADADVVRKLRNLAAELGYRIEPITPEPVHIKDGAML